MKLIDIVRDNVVKFDHLRAGFAYYNVKVDGNVYQFPVDLTDIGDATLMKEDKATFFMRWIRKSIDDKTFVQAVAA